MWVAVLVALIVAYVVYMINENSYWPRKNIRNLTSYIPWVGNTWPVVFQRECMFDTINRIYNAFPEEKYFGFRNLVKPYILMRDLDLLKQIAIKDSNYFVDHAWDITKDMDPFLAHNIHFMKGNTWRKFRGTLSPAFSTSKIRGMFVFMMEVGEQLVEYIKSEAEKPKNIKKQYVDIELKDLFRRYTNDVIATNVFGVSINSFKDKNNEVFLAGKDLTTLRPSQMFKFILHNKMLWLMKFFNITLVTDKSRRVFTDLVLNSLRLREESGVFRPDMIQLILEAKRGTLSYNEKNEDVGFATTKDEDTKRIDTDIKWTDEFIVGSAALFYFAGYSSSSDGCALGIYEIAKNPEIHKKLQKEVDEVAERNNGKVSYEELIQMKYLDMVVSEVLRVWTPIINSDRKCTQNYTLPPSNDKSTKGGNLTVGDGVLIPIHAIHHDPQYFKNPEIFDPERFSDERKHEINPNAYIPFGLGPRNCIGSRFALIEIKTALFYTMLNFDVFFTDKTDNPLKPDHSVMNIIPESGLWIGISPRKKKN